MPEVTLSLLRAGGPLLVSRLLMMMVLAGGSRPSVRRGREACTLVVAVVLAVSLVACRKSALGKLAADECPPVAGRALVVESVRLRAVGSPGAPDGVIESQAAFAASGYQLEGQPRAVLPEGAAALPEPPPFDFAKHRIAYASTRQNPNLSPVWVVETPTDIVVGLRIEAYCGGAAPPDGLVGVLVPTSSKPVRFARCSTGACDPNVARP